MGHLISPARAAFNVVRAVSSKFFSQANRVNVALAEDIAPVYQTASGAFRLRLYCENPLLLWRAQTAFSKEPDTVEWIDTFKKDDVFFDVGANIGIYTILAAQKGATVFAFEPESKNYALLNRNVVLNNVQANVTAYCMGLDQSERLDCLNLSTLSTGGALHAIGEAKDFNDQAFEAKFKQGIFTSSLDILVYQRNLPKPDHLKIDVDGLEHLILLGAKQLLKDSDLKTLLIELNMGIERDRTMLDLITSSGFECVRKYHAPMFDAGQFKDVFNFTFRRGNSALS